ncbi:MAG: hypothetical protein OXB98_20625 [Bryobacterales bacterium]|nr:hypothetical protein [Bryobacterales bacterium]
MGDRVSDHCNIVLQGESSGVMKRKTSELKRVKTILTTLLLTAAIPSRQSEQNRKDESMREVLRSAIGVIETARQESIAAQRENVEIHEKQPFKKSILATKTPLQAGREKLERIVKENGKGRQDTMRERIDETSGEERIMTALEPGRIGEKADSGKTRTETAVSRWKQRMAAPRQQRMP